MRLEIESTTAAPPPADQIVSETGRANTVSEVQEFLKSGIKAAQNGDRAGARTALLRATELDPRNENAWLWLASISEYPEELLVFLNNVLDINPENARALEWRSATNSLLAKTLIQRGIDAAEENQKEQATEYFSKALEYDQQNAVAWMWLASFSDSNEGKLLYLEKALALEPENEDAISAYREAKYSITSGHLAEAKAAAVAGRTAEAHALLNAVLEEMPDSEDAWMLRSHFADSFDEKISSFERVLEINPDNAAAAASLDSLRSLVGETEAQDEMPDMASAEAKVEADAAEPAKEHYAEAAFSEEAIAAEPEVEAVEIVEEQNSDEASSFASSEAARLYEEEPEHKSPTQDLVMPEGVSEAFAEANVEPLSTEAQGGPFAELATEVPVHEVAAEVVEENVDAPAEQPDAQAGMETVSYHPEEDQPANSFDPDLTNYISFAELNAMKDADPGQAEVNGFENGSAEVIEQEYEDGTIEEVRMSEPEPVPADNSAAVENKDFDPFATMYSVPSLNSLFDESVKAAISGDSNEKGNGTNGVAMPEEGEAPFAPEVTFVAAPDPFSAEAPPAFDSIPRPEADLSFPSGAQVPSGFETTIVPSSGPTGSVSHCSFCSFGNEPQAIVCGNCLSVLTLSDLEMLLANTNADRAVLRIAIENVELERATRQLDEQELTMLGIGYLNLQNLDAGHAVLLEASKLNPNNVVLSSQVNALHIRIEEIRKQKEEQGEQTIGKKILVVDDSPTIRKLISGKLEKCGHDVFCSADGVEAIERLQNFVPDLILLDITMPRMDGYQVCKMIRSNEATKDIPVVMISGKDGFFDKVRGRMAGTSGYITKPFGPETLMKVVEGFLKNGIAAEVVEQ